MHMTRPKSSKGRTRARVTQALAVDEGVHQGHVFLPHPPPPAAPPSFSSSTVVSPRTVLRQASKPSADVLTEVFTERPPDEVMAPVLNFNKYKVLPSIEKRPEGEVLIRGIEEKASRLSLSDSSLRGQTDLHIARLCSRAASRSDSEMRLASEEQCGSTAAADTWRTAHGHSGSETGVGDAADAHLLLAIRTPCGQRFKCHFQPTDTLQTVISSVEAKSGERYEHAVIETMEVPRQTFTDLTRSLSQCGIFNKSVLLISIEDSAMDSD